MDLVRDFFNIKRLNIIKYSNKLPDLSVINLLLKLSMYLLPIV